MNNWLEEIKARAERATKGPWRVEDDCVTAQVDNGYPNGKTIERIFPPISGRLSHFQRTANTYFAAYAREDIPKFVDLLERCILFAEAMANPNGDPVMKRVYAQATLKMLCSGEVKDRIT